MHLSIIAIGRVREPYLVAGMREYEKRLRAYGRISIREIKEEPYRDPVGDHQAWEIKEKEGARILAAVAPTDYLIALDPQGRSFTSEGFAQHIQQRLVEGRSSISFAIGGSLGLGNNVRQRADLILSFSQFTFPHQLFRLILLEQLYRMATILRGEPYHR
ncbi:MAG: 23S rRNA (pseudouridine(1915)-N(3))-methyltransferase RlmH [Limnochordia bacterium]|jgi:23S rRNA (pseudouridine1915-N3)-methyltransferase